MIRFPQAVLLMLLAVVPALTLGAQCTPSSDCVISPAKVEVNLGTLPIDYYFSRNDNTNPRIIPNCAGDGSRTVQDCVKDMLASYCPTGQGHCSAGQGATGVRILFGLGGGGHSTPFAPNGGINSCWLDRLNAFLADVKYYGYTNVTPTPVLVDDWSAFEGSPYYTTRSVSTCGGTKTLRFFKWLPFGLDPNDYYFPDCRGVNNNGYNQAANNPDFWEWSPYIRLLHYVFLKMAQNGLTVGDFDMHNELDLMNFTVLGRLIYDNVNSYDVLAAVRTEIEEHFSGAGSRVTFSTRMQRPSTTTANCDSYYQDKAMIIRESELYAALNNDYIGVPGGNFNVTNNLHCDGSSDGMIKLGLINGPFPYSQPTVTNIHAHVCVSVGGLNPDESQCTTTTADTVAKNLYDGVWAFLTQRGLTSNKVMFGEVNHTQTLAPPQPPACVAYYYAARAYDNVTGFLQSSLYTSDASNVVLRVWGDMQNSCYTMPNQINPPYRPQ